MGHWQSDVFIEMKDFNVLPLDTRQLSECVKKFKLRRGRGDNNPCPPVRDDGTANGICRLFRGRESHTCFVVKDFEHASYRSHIHSRK
jgi:hypothetical protein